MLDIAGLIAQAGGDPWEINRTLQAGSPLQINNLAQAFHNAGRCTAEASETFDQAKKRFDAAWNHQDGDHPINDSAEVQRVSKALGAQSLQLPKIGSDLENIAAALAEAQQRGSAEIATLNRQLELLDKVVVAAQKDLQDGNLDENSRHALLTLIEDAKADEADDVRDALVQMRLIRGIYAGSLHAGQASLAKDGYDPAGIWAEDAHQSLGPGGAPLNTGGGKGPRIDGPATPPLMEGVNSGQQDDLDVTIPGTGIALGGDGKDGYPHIHIPGVYDGKNPLPVPDGYRPLPTGTATGPNGEHYGFYAIVPYQTPDGQPNQHYTAPDTVVVDLAHPDTPLYTLKGISQASGAYDPQSGRMVIMGNDANGQRGLWQSTPVGQNPAWGKSPLESLGTFKGGMNGNRESQLVALPKGGFMAVGAGETVNAQGRPVTLPLQGAVASDARGLLTAPTTELVTPQTLPQVYGPSITGIQEIDGKEVVSMRVSTYGDGVYDPHTYTTTFTVTPGS